MQTSFYFENPEFLYLLALVPAFIYFYYFWYAKKRLVVKLSYNPEKLFKPKRNLTFLRHIPPVLQTIALTAMIFAISRPQFSHDSVEKSSEGIDIVISLDVSGSMDGKEMGDTRIEIAKQKAVEFIKGRVDDRIGMVLFAQDALTYAPLTTDYEFLKQQIKEINLGVLPKQGTAVGSGIAVAVNLLRESDRPSKVIILLTDGSNNSGKIDPLTAAQLALKHNIKIYSIGIGKKEYSAPDPFGGMQYYQSDVDYETMQKISQLTNGESFSAEDPKGLSKIFDKISKMEKTEVREDVYKNKQDLYPKILLFSAILLSIAYGLVAFNFNNPLEE